MSLAQIGQRLERSSGEIFRMLAALERRGYLARGPRPEQYMLTHKLYELAHRHPPAKRILACALPAMEELAQKVQQSCHLAVRHGDAALIVAQVDCPGFTGFSVRVGATAPLVDCCSGRVLLSFQDAPTRKTWIGGALMASKDGTTAAALNPLLSNIAHQGWHRQESRIHPGIVDFGAPVMDHDGHALAALTVPNLRAVHSSTDDRLMISALQAATARIAECLGNPALNAE